MAKKPILTLLMYCAGGVAAFSGWQFGEQLLPQDASASVSTVSRASFSFPTSNRDSKRDRDIVIAPQAETAAPVLAAYAAEEPPTASIPSLASKTAAVEDARAELAPLSAPTPKAKAVAKIEKIGRSLLSDFQIAGIKQRLGLTSAQERYWPPVEKALRGLSERVAAYRKGLKKSHDDAENAEIEQLKAAALPLLAQLRDDQKSQVIVLANMAGLGSIVTDLFNGGEVASNSN